MELSNEFEVSVPIGEAWAILTDVERIAPCLPGAQLQEVEGDEFRGIVKIKVGPISAQYKGAAHFVERDEAGYRAVLSASGRDTRGQGNASASITAELTPKGDVTHVSVLTDLTITGKVAQFGRGVIGDVSVKLLDQFVDNLEATVLAGEAAGTTVETAEMLASELTKVWEKTDAPDPVRASRPALAPRPDLLAAEQGLAPTPSNGSGARKIDAPEAQPIDLLETAGSSVARRVVPVAVVALVAAIVFVLLRRRAR